MLSFRVRGRVVSVLCSEVDPALGEVDLTVELERRHKLDAGHILRAEGVPGHRLWLVHLPAELFDGHPHLIGLQIRSGDRVHEDASFSFIGSDQVLSPPRSRLLDADAAEPEKASLDSAAPIVPDDAAPPAKSPATEGRHRLRQFLDEEFGTDAAKRLLGYFDIIEELGAASGESRRELLASHLERIQLLSRAANDARPVEASIVIPVFGAVEYTIASVISLLEHPSTTRYEIIIANDASADETAAIFGAVGGVIRCITQETNRGFVRNCNLSAGHAAGRYVVLLNNDTLILDHWLDELLAPFGRFNGVGLVGSKLLMTDGSLQEAGGIIWRDASGWNFGRGQDPTLPQFNYVKDVDYVSGAAIAIPKALWDEMGGFDERFVPAYFEDSDLAFTLREKGWRALYAPASQVIHHEGISHGNDKATGIKAYQGFNRDKFIAKWQAILASGHYPNGEQVFLARDRSGDRRHILVVDHCIPQFDRDAGSRTIFSYLKMFVDGGLRVSFWPDNLHRDREYLKALQDLGVEVLYGTHLVGQFPEWIKENGAYLDYAFLSRAHVSRNYIDNLREYSEAKILYYGHELPYERLEAEYKLTGKAALKQEIEYCRKAEMEIWRKSDVIYYSAEDEVEAVRQAMPDKIARPLSICVYPDNELEAPPLGGARSGPPTVMFVASFRHRPNVDAVLWFVREVLPLVRLRIPELRTILAGSFPPPAVTGLANERVLVTGYISDTVLDWFYRSATLAVLPLRFGGGVKGQLIEALRFGVPVVTTSAGARGLPEPETYVSIGDTPQLFAERIIKVVENPGLAQPRVLRGLDYIQREFASSSVAARMAVDIPELGSLASGPGRLARAEPKHETSPGGPRTARGRRAAAVTRSQALRRAPDIAGDVTVVLTSCGRQDLLEQTLDSFFVHNTYPIREFVVIEDGDGRKNEHLSQKYQKHSLTWLDTGTRVGQVAAIDAAYSRVKTDFLFHCEDDWEFLRPRFIERSLKVLNADEKILQVYLRDKDDTNGHPVSDQVYFAEWVPYRLVGRDYDAGKWGIWHGFSWNPGLRRRRDYQLLGSFGSLDPSGTNLPWQIERDASLFYRTHDFVAAILAEDNGPGYVRHLGDDRHVLEIRSDGSGFASQQ